MKTFKILTVVCLFVFITKKSYAQTAYLETDSTKYTGVQLISSSPIKNANLIRQKVGVEILKFTPEQLRGYGLEDGRVYQSFKMQVDDLENIWFFERIHQGENSLYYLPIGNENYFFVSKDHGETLQEIPRDNLASFLKSTFPNCHSINLYVEKVRYTKNSLTRFFKNADLCVDSSLPEIRFGFIAGKSFNTLADGSVSELTPDGNFSSISGYFLGVEMSSPIGVTNFSFVTGANFHFIKGSNSYTSDATDYDLVINQSRVYLPLHLRYAIYRKKHLPFLEFGPTYSKYLSGDDLLLTYRISQSRVLIDSDELQALGKNQLGLSFNAGLIINQNHKSSIKCQAGYNKVYSFNGKNETLNLKQWHFSIGILF